MCEGDRSSVASYKEGSGSGLGKWRTFSVLRKKSSLIYFLHFSGQGSFLFIIMPGVYRVVGYNLRIKPPALCNLPDIFFLKWI